MLYTSSTGASRVFTTLVCVALMLIVIDHQLLGSCLLGATFVAALAWSQRPSPRLSARPYDWEDELG